MKRYRIMYAALAIALSLTMPAALPAATVITGEVTPLPWDSSTVVVIGYRGNGSLGVDAASQVVSGSAYLGYYYPATGEATITGAGSQWTNSEALYVGYWAWEWFGGCCASGRLTVEDGGEVTTGTLWASLDDLHGDGTIAATKGAVLDDADLTFDAAHGTQAVLDFGSGGKLTVTVTGEGALGVGYKGLGSLTVADGIAISSSSGQLGWMEGSTGEATITGPGSTWTIDQYLSIGNAGSGTLTITGGAAVSSVDANIGSERRGWGGGSGGSAQVAVDGVGSTWTNSGSLMIGQHFGDTPYYKAGTLTITGGGLVSIGGGLWMEHSFVNMSRGGMLALKGDAADLLAQFYGIRYWDTGLADWAPLSEATYGDDYTLEFLTSGELAGYTLLTVGVIPEPASILALSGIFGLLMIRRRR